LASRSGNLVLNTALVIALGLTILLVYALGQRVTSPRPDPARLDNPGNLLGNYVQLEVLNGTGVDGLAGEMSEYLQDLGFDVVGVGNHEGAAVSRTMIFDRVGNRDAAEQIALALGIEADHIEEALEPEWYLDASLVIGPDFATVKPFADRLSAETVDGASDTDGGED
jgi:hypothetical protein